MAELIKAVATDETLQDTNDQLSAIAAALNIAQRVDGSTLVANSNNVVSVLGVNNAGFHNSLFRGKYLGASYTADQKAAIQGGTFNDLFIGDYWTIGGVNWHIANFDYWLRYGDTECTTHHAVIVPDTILYSAKMNDSNVTTGAYIGSAMYTTNLASAKTTINNAFGSANILNHREFLQNAVANGRASAGSWYDSTVELMNEHMVYGGKFFEPTSDGTNIPYIYSIDKSQLALFRHAPEFITNRSGWWLRDVVSAASFAYVAYDGRANSDGASGSYGVRPCFGLC